VPNLAFIKDPFGNKKKNDLRKIKKLKRKQCIDNQAG
jgi:hypothetical protein